MIPRNAGFEALQFGLSFWFGLALTALLLALTHWFPWPRPLRRLERYFCGASSILIGISIWLGVQRLWLLVIGVAAFFLCAGIVTGAAYLYDAYRNAGIRAGLYGTDE